MYFRSSVFVLALTSIFSLAGCYELDKIFYKGSVRAVASCIEDREAEIGLLSPVTIKQDCVDDNEATIDRSGLTGSLWLDVRAGGDLRVRRILIRDVPDDHVITEISFVVRLRDARSEEFNIRFTKPIWIEGPRESFEWPDGFSIPKPDDLFLPSELYNGYCGNNDIQEYCYTWRITGVKGLTM